MHRGRRNKSDQMKLLIVHVIDPYTTLNNCDDCITLDNTLKLRVLCGHPENPISTGHHKQTTPTKNLD